MALIAAIWNGSCMKARLGTISSSKVRMSKGLPQGAPESPIIFTMFMELVLRIPIKSWITMKLAWRLDDFVLVAASVAVAEVMVTEVIAKLKGVGLTVGAQKTHWTSHPKMADRSIDDTTQQRPFPSHCLRVKPSHKFPSSFQSCTSCSVLHTVQRLSIQKLCQCNVDLRIDFNGMGTCVDIVNRQYWCFLLSCSSKRLSRRRDHVCGHVLELE